MCFGKYRFGWLPGIPPFASWNRALRALSFQTIANSNLLQALTPCPHPGYFLHPSGLLAVKGYSPGRLLIGKAPGPVSDHLVALLDREGSGHDEVY